MRHRLDKSLMHRKIVSSRSKAQFLFLSGAVYVNDEPAKKLSQKVGPEDEITVLQDSSFWVSRGALKLEYALKTFKLGPFKGYALDIGASTGGFTQVLLHHGVDMVYAIDVGRGQLNKQLAEDDRVVNIEGVNARNIDQVDLPFFDYIVCDVSFISLDKVLFKPLEKAKDSCILIVLIKPQFEVGPRKVGKKGIVKDPDLWEQACKKCIKFLFFQSWQVKQIIKSPIKGSDGNVEFLALATKLM